MIQTAKGGGKGQAQCRRLKLEPGPASAEEFGKNDAQRHRFGKSCEAFLLVVVLVLALGFSGSLDYEHEEHDESGLWLVRD
jgi:hypothetical protein